MVGTAQTIHAFRPLLQKGNEKKVLVVSSTMGVTAYALKVSSDIAVGYSVSKAALNMLVAKYALACKEDGIAVVAVSPGFVRTMRGGESNIVIVS